MMAIYARFTRILSSKCLYLYTQTVGRRPKWSKIARPKKPRNLRPPRNERAGWREPKTLLLKVRPLFRIESLALWMRVCGLINFVVAFQVIRISYPESLSYGQVCSYGNFSNLTVIFAMFAIWCRIQHFVDFSPGLAHLLTLTGHSL